jgi:zinc transport system substrate-binding protein
MISYRSISCGLLTVVLATAWTGCNRSTPTEQPGPAVAVANSFLGAAARQMSGDTADVVELAPPGTCPGHFDIRPSQIDALRACRALFRFDFQSGLDKKLAPLAADGLRIESVELDAGLCTPSAYIRACRQVGDALTDAGLVTADEQAERFRAVQKRMHDLANSIKTQIKDAGLNELRVVSSGHQADFCKFLGLDVVATLGGSDTTSVSTINSALAEGESVQAVIANLPEGRRLADAIGQRLDVPVVVFANFPDQTNHNGQFDELVRANTARLIEALRE